MQQNVIIYNNEIYATEIIDFQWINLVKLLLCLIIKVYCLVKTRENIYKYVLE